jgi:hypothetical protein
MEFRSERTGRLELDGARARVPARQAVQHLTKCKQIDILMRQLLMPPGWD